MMATVVVNISDAKTHLSRLLRQVAAGDDVIVAKAGKPVARLVPVERPLPRVPGQWKGKVTRAFFEPLPSPELDDWQ